MTMMIEHRRVESSRARGRRANHCSAMDARAARVWLHVRGFSTSESVMGILLAQRRAGSAALEQLAAWFVSGGSGVGAADGPTPHTDHLFGPPNTLPRASLPVWFA